jgi:hypothetical protein
VQVQTQLRPEPPTCTRPGRQNLVHFRIVFEYSPEAVFDYDSEAQIGSVLFENMKRGSREYAIAQRS